MIAYGTDKASDQDVAEAGAILERLRGVSAQYATSETVTEYQRVASLLSGIKGSPLWSESLINLAMHLIECPEGNRTKNIESAQNVLREVLKYASINDSTDVWVSATWELANSLWLHPSATHTNFEEACALYDLIINHLKKTANGKDLALVLGNCAHMHSVWPVGDVDAHLDRAISIQEEAIQCLAHLPDLTNREHLGRAYYSLGRLYLKRREGARSLNVDRAIHALQESLKARPVEQDPIGRVRTLRALAYAYPEWSAPTSPAHARQLARAAKEEADQIEQSDDRAARRTSGWVSFERQQSALMQDLDELLDEDAPPEQRLDLLDRIIINHQEVLRKIPSDSMPVQWAEWMGGLGRLLGRYPSLGVWEHLKAAYHCFNSALAAIKSSEHPRLYRELLRRFGELCHEIGDFHGSLQTYGAAADLTEALFESFTDPEHQWIELEQTRELALFAAYAAARLGQPETAARFAEQQRTRGLKDLLDARRVLQMASEGQKNEVYDATTHIQQIEESLRQLKQRDLETTVLELRAKLADFAGVDPSILQVRRIDEKAYAPNPVGEQQDRLSSELGEARRALRRLLKPQQSGDDAYSRSFGSAEIASVAQVTNRALVYIVATVHGGMAINVLPNGSFATLPLSDMTSDVTKMLLLGNNEVPGFLSGLVSDNSDAFQKSLNAIQSILGPALMVPLIHWLRASEVERVVLIPLGFVGLLPLHIAADNEVMLSYAPSARAIALSSAALAREIKAKTLVVANPSWEEDPLPFAVAEARAIATLMDNEKTLLNIDTFVRTCVAADATLEGLHKAADNTTCVHIACHGVFSPSNPLTSYLSLAGNDRLNLVDVFYSHVDFSKTRLITLSACQSGKVEFRRASDESLGFPTALMLAGVPSIVSTLWNVDDAAAMFFTVRFYELLVGANLEPVEALARARAWLRQVEADELTIRLSSIRATLEPSDDKTDNALSDLWRILKYNPPSEPPYKSVEMWGAFILTGT